MNPTTLISKQLYSGGPDLKCPRCNVLGPHRVNTKDWVCCHNCANHYSLRELRTPLILDCSVYVKEKQ